MPAGCQLQLQRHNAGNEYAWQFRVRYWDVAKIRDQFPLSALRNTPVCIKALLSRPDGKSSGFGGSADGDIRLWDVETHELIGVLGTLLQRRSTQSLLSQGKATLASVSEDDSIVLWDVDFRDWVSRACRIANRDLTPKGMEYILWNQPLPENLSESLRVPLSECRLQGGRQASHMVHIHVIE